MNKRVHDNEPASAPDDSGKDTGPNQHTIAAVRVDEHRRTEILPHYLGRQMFLGEVMVYATLDSMCSEYDGGYWEFYELSNGGFYMAPAKDEPLRLMVSGNGFDGTVSADAAGIIATLMALNQLSWRTRDARCIHLFYLLREYALDHAESSLILRAID
jgi:hypothetical protein